MCVSIDVQSRDIHTHKGRPLYFTPSTHSAEGSRAVGSHVQRSAGLLFRRYREEKRDAVDRRPRAAGCLARTIAQSKSIFEGRAHREPPPRREGGGCCVAAASVGLRFENARG